MLYQKWYFGAICNVKGDVVSQTVLLKLLHVQTDTSKSKMAPLKRHVYNWILFGGVCNSSIEKETSTKLFLTLWKGFVSRITSKWRLIEKAQFLFIINSKNFGESLPRLRTVAFIFDSQKLPDLKKINWEVFADWAVDLLKSRTTYRIPNIRLKIQTRIILRRKNWMNKNINGVILGDFDTWLLSKMRRPRCTNLTLACTIDSNFLHVNYSSLLHSSLPSKKLKLSAANQRVCFKIPLR